MRILMNKSGNSTLLFLGAVGLLSLAASSTHLARLAEVRDGFRNNRLVSVRDSLAQRISQSSELPGIFRNSIDPNLGNPNPELKACLLGEASCLLDGTTSYPVSLYAPNAHASISAISGGNQPVRYDGFGNICQAPGAFTSLAASSQSPASPASAPTLNNDCLFEVRTSFTAACIGSTPTSCSGIEIRVSYSIGISSGLKISPVSGLANPVSQQKIFPPLPGYAPTLIQSQLIAVITTTTPGSAPTTTPATAAIEQAIRNVGLTNDTVVQMILSSGLDLGRSVDFAEILLGKPTFPPTDAIAAFLTEYQKEGSSGRLIAMFIPGVLASAESFNAAVAAANSMGTDASIRGGIIEAGIIDPVVGRRIYDTVSGLGVWGVLGYSLGYAQITDPGAGQRMVDLQQSLGMDNQGWDRYIVNREIAVQGITDPVVARLMWDSETTSPQGLQFIRNSGFQDVFIAGALYYNGITQMTEATQIYNAITASGVTDHGVIRDVVAMRWTSVQDIQTLASQMSNNQQAIANSNSGSGSSSSGSSNSGSSSTSSSGTSTSTTSGSGSTSTTTTVVTVGGTLIDSCTAGSCSPISF